MGKLKIYFYCVFVGLLVFGFIKGHFQKESKSKDLYVESTKIGPAADFENNLKSGKSIEDNVGNTDSTSDSTSQIGNVNNNDNSNNEIVSNDTAEVSILEIYAEHNKMLDGVTNNTFPLLLKVRVKNTGTGDQDWYTNPYSFTISSDDGRTYEYTGGTKLNQYGERESVIPDLHLRSGQNAEGWIGFKPEWGTKFILNYEDNNSNVEIPFELPEGQEKISIVPPNPISATISKD